MMIEAGPSEGERRSPAAPTQTRPDFSVIQGFQVVGADHLAAGQRAALDEGWRDALRLELETRAARFHQAVDFRDCAFERWRHSMVGRPCRQTVSWHKRAYSRSCNVGRRSPASYSAGRCKGAN